MYTLYAIRYTHAVAWRESCSSILHSRFSMEAKMNGDSSRKRARPASPSSELVGTTLQEAGIRTENVKRGTECPYMDTINRSALDFDFERVCSVSLEKRNVYACLTTGKFFQGRGPTSHAYAHALDGDHHLFINLQTGKVYCLPEMYVVEDPGLADIAYAVRPTFTDAEISALDTVKRKFRVLNGAKRLRGIVGIDNLKATDYAGVVFQFLFCIPPVRDCLLRASREEPVANDTRSELLHAMSTLACKVWSKTAFRAHISPHEVMQVVARASKQRFVLHKQGDAVQFLAWILNIFSKGGKSSSVDPFADVLRSCFQGKMDVITFANDELKDESEGNPFWFLTLDLPPKPLFKDNHENTSVRRVRLQALLKKYDGVTRQNIIKSGEQKAYRLAHLPPYLILTVKRLVRSKFSFEKNPCIVDLPVEKLAIEDKIGQTTLYSLAAAIIHDGEAENGKYRVALRHKASGNWYSLSDMAVEKTMPQLVALSETYLLLYSKE